MWRVNRRHLTHISLVSFLWDIGKQCRSRSYAAERGVWKGSLLFAYRMFYWNLNNKWNTTQQLLNGNGLVQLIIVGNSIRLKWFNNNCVERYVCHRNLIRAFISNWALNSFVKYQNESRCWTGKFSHTGHKARSHSINGMAFHNDLNRHMWFPTMWHFDNEPVQPHVRNSKWCLVSSLAVI